METVGFIGLGNMGSGMAGNIQKADYPLVIYDLRHESTRPFVDRGARYAASPAEVARQCEVTFTSLPGPAEVEAVALGAQGILDRHQARGSIRRSLHQPSDADPADRAPVSGQRGTRARCPGEWWEERCSDAQSGGDGRW